MDVIFEDGPSPSCLMTAPEGFLSVAVQPENVSIVSIIHGVIEISDSEVIEINVLNWSLNENQSIYRRGDNFKEFQVRHKGVIHRLRQSDSIFFSDCPGVQISNKSRFGKEVYQEDPPKVNLIPEIDGNEGFLFAQVRPFRYRFFELFGGESVYLQIFKFELGAGLVRFAILELETTGVFT